MDGVAEPKSRAHWPLDWRGVIGLLTYGAILGSLYEIRTVVPEGVEIITAPLLANHVTVETLKGMSKDAVEMSKRQ